MHLSPIALQTGRETGGEVSPAHMMNLQGPQGDRRLPYRLHDPVDAAGLYCQRNHDSTLWFLQIKILLFVKFTNANDSLWLDLHLPDHSFKDLKRRSCLTCRYQLHFQSPAPTWLSHFQRARLFWHLVLIPSSGTNQQFGKWPIQGAALCKGLFGIFFCVQPTRGKKRKGLCPPAASFLHWHCNLLKVREQKEKFSGEILLGLD